jgi:hypothetical protein
MEFLQKKGPILFGPQPVFDLELLQRRTSSEIEFRRELNQARIMRRLPTTASESLAFRR